MDNTLDGIDRQRTAIALSGIAEVEKLFSDGYNADLGLLSKTILSAGYLVF